MDFELSADQEALGAAARDLLDGYAAPAQVRVLADAGGGLDGALWGAMVDQGWSALTVPEARGGIGFGLVEAAVLAEAVGAHVAPAPFVSQIVALEALGRASDREVAEAGPWIDRLAAGEAVAAVAWTPVSARPTPAGWVLDGRTEPAVFAPSADVVVVHARAVEDGPGGIAAGEDVVCLVALTDDLRPRREPAMDVTREVGWLHFDDTPTVLLGGAAEADAFLDAGATLLAAEMLGLSARAMDLAVGYAQDRQQFGKPIGSFQAVKHRCADMLVDVEGMRSTAYYAAWCYAADDRDRAIAASTAKSWCGDAAKRVCASSLQVHGGIGFTWECDVHLFLKRAQLDQVSFGDASFHRTRLARLLRRRVEAGESVI